MPQHVCAAFLAVPLRMVCDGAFWFPQAGCGRPHFGLLQCASPRRGSGLVHLSVLFSAWSFPAWLISAWFSSSVIVLCMVFHGEVLSASHHPQPSQFFWIDLCSDHLSVMRLSPDQPASVCFVQRIDLHGEVFSCFGMVVPATVRSASVGSLTCGSFQHGSFERGRGRLPWRAPLGFSAFFSQLGPPGLFSSTRFFSLRVILLRQLFCSAWFSVLLFLRVVLLGMVFSQRGFLL